MSSELLTVWRQGAFKVPEGQAGPWRVVRSFITPRQAAENQRQAEAFGGPVRYSPAGFYTALVRDGDVWMADTPDEMLDHLECFEQAKARGGRVLIHGLGLGLIARAVLSLENVTHVDVVEVDYDVIKLVRPAFINHVQNGRMSIRHGDCFSNRWLPEDRWTVVWHDIWQGMVEENLPEMDRLHRLFADRCDWQGSWGEQWILEQRSRRIRYGNELGVEQPPVAVYRPD